MIIRNGIVRGGVVEDDQLTLRSIRIPNALYVALIPFSVLLSYYPAQPREVVAVT